MKRVLEVIDDLFSFKLVKEIHIKEAKKNKKLLVKLVTDKDNYEDIRSLTDQYNDEATFVIIKRTKNGK